MNRVILANSPYMTIAHYMSVTPCGRMKEGCEFLALKRWRLPPTAESSLALSLA